MKAYVFPGQGTQFVGMGKDLYNSSTLAKQMFEKANKIIGFPLTDIMFSGLSEELNKTKNTQPAIFLHSIILTELMSTDFKPSMVAGHSFGEISALVAAKAISFEDGLKIVIVRSRAMQEACENYKTTMAVIVGLEDFIIEKVCSSLDEVVVAANYNYPGQLVISGDSLGVNKAIAILKERGAGNAIILPVSGGFHSPFMKPSKDKLADTICSIEFKKPICPIYQNVDGLPHVNPTEIKHNLVNQITSAVLWKQSVNNMISDGATSFTEVGYGNTLKNIIKRINQVIKIE